MAQDKQAQAQVKPPRAKIGEMFRRKPDADEAHQVLTLPSMTEGAAVPKPGAPGIDLSGQAPLWLLIGAGGAGKTLLARWIGGKLAEAEALEGTVLAALDPTNRTLADFFEGVQQPPSAIPARVAVWLREVLTFVSANRTPGIIDLGGGDTSLMQLISTSPRFAEPLQAAGVAVVAAYVLSPRVDDLTLLGGFEAQGFAPPATALVLNLGRAESPDDFDALRRHPAYKAALARGAVELWMPRLEPQGLGLEIERKRAHFFQARDGVTQPGMRPADLSPFERMIVGDWLRQMDVNFAPVATWMPEARP